MSQNLILKIKGKDTLDKCIIPVNNTTYLDSINKSFDYVDHSQYSITVNNGCGTAFVLPAQVLFTQVDNLGSTFEASIKDTVIPANTTIQVPVYYNGIYNGVQTDPTYTFVLNGVTINYKLLIIIPDTLGSIVEFTINLGNRVDRVFTPSDFTTHFTDPNGDTIVKVYLLGDVNTITFNNAPYVANTPVTMQDIQLGKLKHVAPNIDPYNSVTGLYYKVEDNLGNIIE